MRLLSPSSKHCLKLWGFFCQKDELCCSYCCSYSLAKIMKNKWKRMKFICYWKMSRSRETKVRDKEERRYFIETMLLKKRWKERRMGFMRISLSICLRIAEMSVDVILSSVYQINEYSNVAITNFPNIFPKLIFSFISLKSIYFFLAPLFFALIVLHFDLIIWNLNRSDLF